MDYLCGMKDGCDATKRMKPSPLGCAFRAFPLLRSRLFLQQFEGSINSRRRALKSSLSLEQFLFQHYILLVTQLACLDEIEDIDGRRAAHEEDLAS